MGTQTAAVAEKLAVAAQYARSGYQNLASARFYHALAGVDKKHHNAVSERADSDEAERLRRESNRDFAMAAWLLEKEVETDLKNADWD
jgi:hypothetical protein